MTVLSSRHSESFERARDLWIPIAARSGGPRPESYELQPVARSEDDAGIKASCRSLFAFTTRQHALSILVAGISTIAAGVLKPVAAIFYGDIFSAMANFGAGTLSGQETLTEVSKWCISLTVLGAVAWVTEGALLSTWMVFGELQAKSVREQMFTGMLDKDMDWYDLRNDGIGSLLIRIQTQIRELQLAVSQPLGFLLYEVVGALAALTTAFYFSWKLTLVIIATFPLAAIALSLVSMRLGPAIEAQKRELTQASKYASTAFTAIDTVKAFNGQGQEVWQYYSAIKKAAKHYGIQARANALQFGITKFMMIGIFVLGFWYGISLANKGMNPGHVLTTFYACLNAMQAIEVVLPQWLVLTKGMSAGQTLKLINVQLKRGRKVTNMAGAMKPTSCNGDVEINCVSFAYPSNPRQHVLSHINFFFPAGEMTFIVGTSGSGKSTLGNLLLKFYEPLWGDILVDGNSIQTLDTDWLRHNISLVQQQSVLFNETLAQNIAFGTHNETTEWAIKAACEAAGLDEVMNELPDGLNTVVGSGGRSLSGGQNQRVSIARACIRDAPILILDESTSALDQTGRKEVMEAIREWRKGKTTIIITHDISQILDDDYVYVLEHGMVVQEGYCKALAENSHGTFATFRSSSQVTEGRSIDLRRTSDPVSPSYSESDISFNEEFPQHWSTISKIFGTPEMKRNGFGKSTSIQGNHRMSLGVGTLQVNDIRTDNIWSSPVIPEEAFPRPQRQSLSSAPFMSPRPPPRKPSSNSSPLPLRNAKPASPNVVDVYKSNSKDLKRRPQLPAIDTALAHRGALITKAQLTAKFKREGDLIKAGNIKQASLKKIFGTIWPTLTWKNRLILLFGFFAAFVVAAATPAFAIVFAKLLNAFYIKENQAAEARKWGLSMLAIALVDGVSSFCTHYALEYSGEAWVNSLRVAALKRILTQPKSWFDKAKNSPERLNECLDRNAEEMRNLIGRFAGLVFTVIWMLGISVVWSLMISWRLTFVALATGPVMYLITRIFHWLTSKWEDKCNKASENTSSIFTETFSNIRVVRALTLERHFDSKHSKATADTYKIGLKRAIYSGLLFGLTDTVSLSITSLIFYYGVKITTNGNVSISDIIGVINLLIFGISNATNILAFVPQISSARTTATQMLHLANLPQQNSHDVQGTQRLTTPLPVQLNKLSFKYPSQHRILRDISLSINAGTCTAIVGPSGSGKTTISSILLGLYPPLSSPSDDTPPLTFAGTAIEKCNISALRHHFAIVPQSPILFPTTIVANILYGLLPLSQFNNLSSATSAARDAGIHDFIMSLENGYNTIIGEGGMGLSGGQAQRIVIARALVRRSKLLILDEATSALDSASAEGIRETIRKVMHQDPGMAVVIISHNVEMMRVADTIVMLEEGRIVEKGAFEELRGRGGPFTRLISGVRERAKSPGATRIMTPVQARNRDSWVRKAGN